MDIVGPWFDDVPATFPRLVLRSHTPLSKCSRLGARHFRWVNSYYYEATGYVSAFSNLAKFKLLFRSNNSTGSAVPAWRAEI